ncbi:MAG TPA: hypothetical protein VHT00_08250, partial [Stellaceae bacterium]|nr:hypothetical protein [Stellaceae bacterium]
IDYAIGIPLTHLGVEDPVLPISVNAYLPPQPTIERRYYARCEARDRNNSDRPGRRRRSRLHWGR